MQPPEGDAGILLAACALRFTRAADVIGDSLVGAKAVQSTKGVCRPRAPRLQSFVQRRSKGASRRWKGRPGLGKGGGGHSSPSASLSRRSNRSADGEVLSPASSALGDSATGEPVPVTNVVSQRGCGRSCRPELT